MNKTKLISPKNEKKLKNRNKEIKTGMRAKNFKGTLKMLLKRLGEYKCTLVISVIFAILSAILVVIGPMILNDLMELIIPQPHNNGSYELYQVTKYGIIILSIYLLASVLNYIQGVKIKKKMHK